MSLIADEGGVPIEIQTHSNGPIQLWVELDDHNRPPMDCDYVVGVDMLQELAAATRLQALHAETLARKLQSLQLQTCGQTSLQGLWLGCAGCSKVAQNLVHTLFGKQMARVESLATL